MRKTLASVFLMTLLVTASIDAQQPIENPFRADSSTTPCAVVFGAVRHPGPFELRRSVRLSELLAIAGGLTKGTDGTVQVVHSSEPCFQPNRALQPGPPNTNSGMLKVYAVATLKGELETLNPYLRPGDIVIATEAAPVYITGNVRSPQQVSWKDGLTLTQALALAGGVLPNTRTNRLKIYRARAERIASDVITVDLKRVKKHRDADLVLQPFDIIDVPNKSDHKGGEFIFGDPPTPPLQIIR